MFRGVDHLMMAFEHQEMHSPVSVCPITSDHQEKKLYWKHRY